MLVENHCSRMAKYPRKWEINVIVMRVWIKLNTFCIFSDANWMPNSGFSDSYWMPNFGYSDVQWVPNFGFLTSTECQIWVFLTPIECQILDVWHPMSAKLWISDTLRVPNFGWADVRWVPASTNFYFSFASFSLKRPKMNFLTMEHCSGGYSTWFRANFYFVTGFKKCSKLFKMLKIVQGF